jgi:acetyl-CoA C-acetyltransferase
MSRGVAIVGVGTTGFRATSPGSSYRELTYEAAVKAYAEAGIEPNRIDGFVSTAEDFFEGYSIADEYCNDQLGAVLRPISTVPGDFIQALGQAVMMIRSGAFDIVAVQALSKASNMLTLTELGCLAMDPIYNRPFELGPEFIAGLEMNRFVAERDLSEEQCARVVVKNRRNALTNPLAAHGADLTLDDVLKSAPVSWPLKELEVAATADGAVVMVLAGESTARSLTDTPVWVLGVGWNSDSPTLESRDWVNAPYTRLAATMAYHQAGIRSPRSEIDFAEISDEFAYKELQHFEALMLCGPGESGFLTEAGATEISGELPVNASGGCLGVGHLFEANGAAKVLEVVLQLRGEKGANQIDDVEVGLAHSWRGLPTSTGAVAVLSNS